MPPLSLPTSPTCHGLCQAPCSSYHLNPTCSIHMIILFPDGTAWGSHKVNTLTIQGAKTQTQGKLFPKPMVFLPPHAASLASWMSKLNNFNMENTLIYSASIPHLLESSSRFTSSAKSLPQTNHTFLCIFSVPTCCVHILTITFLVSPLWPGPCLYPHSLAQWLVWVNK